MLAAKSHLTFAQQQSWIAQPTKLELRDVKEKLKALKTEVKRSQQIVPTLLSNLKTQVSSLLSKRQREHASRFELLQRSQQARRGELSSLAFQCKTLATEANELKERNKGLSDQNTELKRRFFDAAKAQSDSAPQAAPYDEGL